MNSPYHDNEGNLIDYYRLFGIETNATPEVVRTAFRMMIKRHHPDTGGSGEVELIDLIIRGYRILSDMNMKTAYDHLLAQLRKTENILPAIPKKRIRYSANLKEMLKIRLLPQGLKRKDILYHLGQDIEILATATELKEGARAYVELPSRMPCPLCQGRHADCHVCRGVGRIHTTSHLEVTIPPGTRDNTILDVDLINIRPDRFTTFRAGSIRIKITCINSTGSE